MKCENALSLKNPAEDNLLKKKKLLCFSTEKKNIFLFGQLGKKGLTTEKSSTPHPLKIKWLAPCGFGL